MKIVLATPSDIDELYALQLLAFESEAKMIGSRDVPALQETEQDHALDFPTWTTLKMVDDQGIMDVGRLMVHPTYRHQGLAEQLLIEVDRQCQGKIKELYTCTKSWSNILLYKKMGYTPVSEHTENTGLSFVYMRKK